MWMYLFGFLCLALPSIEAISENDCSKSNPTPDEDKILDLLCTPSAILANKIVFGHPADNKKFLVCTDVSSGCSGTCPNGVVFNKATSSCGSTSITCPLPKGTDLSSQLQPFDPMMPNPCSQAGSKTCVFFNDNLKHRFVICEQSTTQNPRVGQCMNGYEFDFNTQACVKVDKKIVVCKNVINPCKPIPANQKIINADLLYFGCADDPTKFIQCDRWANMTVKQCKNKTVWSQKDLTCVRN